MESLGSLGRLKSIVRGDLSSLRGSGKGPLTRRRGDTRRAVEEPNKGAGPRKAVGDCGSGKKVSKLGGWQREPNKNLQREGKTYQAASASASWLNVNAVAARDKKTKKRGGGGLDSPGTGSRMHP